MVHSDMQTLGNNNYCSTFSLRTLPDNEDHKAHKQRPPSLSRLGTGTAKVPSVASFSPNLSSHSNRWCMSNYLGPTPLPLCLRQCVVINHHNSLNKQGMTSLSSAYHFPVNQMTIKARY